MLELRDDRVWQVVAVEFIGGASSSDFVNEWFTGETAAVKSYAPRSIINNTETEMRFIIGGIEFDTLL